MDGVLMQNFDRTDMKQHSESDSSQNWIKSSYSMTNGNCIEVAGLSGELIGVRDSKNPAGPVLGILRRPSGTPSSGISVTTRSTAGKDNGGQVPAVKREPAPV